MKSRAETVVNAGTRTGAVGCDLRL